MTSLPADGYLRVWIGFEPPSGGAGYADDIRFRPLDALMTTYTYDAVTRKLTSLTDKNNVTTFFEYDDAGRLTIIRDRDHNILKRNVYNYARGTN